MHKPNVIELEITNRCNLACPRCPRTTFDAFFKKEMPRKDLNLDDVKQFLDPILPDIDLIQFCGSDGDPIFHPNFLDYIKWCKDNNLNIEISTNGNIGKRQFWKDLAKLLDDTDNVILAIDGIPSNFMQYRINAKWDNLEIAIDELKNNCNLVWQYIVFKYNQDNIEEARALSNSMGFDKFDIVLSDRWDTDDYLRPDDQFVTHNTLKEDWRQFKKDPDPIMDPVCHKRSMHIISCDGIYFPCCYVLAYIFKYKTHFWKNKDIYDITRYNIKELLDMNQTKDFYNNLEQNEYCQFTCGKCK